MIFRQLFEDISSTYTYLIGSEQTGRAILVDPVLPTWQRDLEVTRDLGLTLAYTLETHIHADHITSARMMKQEVGSGIAGPSLDGLPCTDVPVDEANPFEMDDVRLEALHTPGHTDNHMAYKLGDRVLTGDALLIDGCGRTDFQNGHAPTLYRSVHDKLFTLPDDQLVHPGHDYHGRWVSTIGQEKGRNARLGQGKSEAEFLEIMSNLNLAHPKFIDHAVPGNQACGECPSDIPEHLQKYCGEMEQSPQG
ncbi:MBL fold metallo-hydrolase [Thiohalorhabdus sp. Cl-TMA]|uniref:MBL fold metallo-hydrolase n=1 Tax=Thiohalorhabdus methylotrophus TaxID=3242694 RepID=A0ABV4TVP2_9GAMM